MITLRSVSKRYGEVTALDGVSLEIPSAGRVALLGPSGCGKTTLLRLIAGLDLPDAGQISIGGRLASTPDAAVEPAHRDLGVVFQRPALWPHMTVAQNVSFGLHALDRTARREQVGAMLHQTGLAGLRDRYPHELSGGQAQRVALARALAPKPMRLLLDEPLAHVDAHARAELLGVIAEVVEGTGATLVYVTHDLEEAATLCTRRCVLRGGRVDAIDGIA